MDERTQRKYLRRRLGRPSWALLIYYGIMNLAVMLVIFADVIFRILRSGLDGVFQSDLMKALTGNAWGYFLAVGIGLIIMLLWKGKRFCFGEIWSRGRPMTVRDLLGLLCVFISGQLLFQMAAMSLEAILNLFGLSVLEAINNASAGADTLSMYLYVGILAPVAEELLFRGLILRTMLPFGKRFSIFTSAFLFGIYHGNLVQSPFAFAVGLVLGYTAVEYSVAWAMVLHMFNNLILSDMQNRLTSGLPETTATLINWGIILVMAAVGLIVLVRKRHQIREYLRRNPLDRQCLHCFFSAPGTIVIMILMGISMLMSVTML